MTSTSRVIARAPIPREGLASMSLYDPAPSTVPVDLTDNTNLWGAPPSAARAIAQYGVATARYPSPYSSALKVRLAKYAGVDPGCIVTGCGSDDVIDAAIRAFGAPGSRLSHPDPSFGMIPAFAAVNGLQAVAIRSGPGDTLDVAGFAAADATISYICTPNNPTGVSPAIESIREIAAGGPGLRVNDRAYAEFAGDDVEPLLGEFDNVLFTRTMSKAFGLAGLRIGYAIGARHIIDAVEKSRGPYKVSSVAESVALNVLDNDLGWVEARVAEVRANRKRFTDALVKLGLDPLPSNANFVLVPVTHGRTVRDELAKDGIAVRMFENLPESGDALRITIGPWDMMQKCLASLTGILT